MTTQRLRLLAGNPSPERLKDRRLRKKKKKGSATRFKRLDFNSGTSTLQITSTLENLKSRKGIDAILSNPKLKKLDACLVDRIELYFDSEMYTDLPEKKKEEQVALFKLVLNTNSKSQSLTSQLEKALKKVTGIASLKKEVTDEKYVADQRKGCSSTEEPSSKSEIQIGSSEDEDKRESIAQMGSPPALLPLNLSSSPPSYLSSRSSFSSESEDSVRGKRDKEIKNIVVSPLSPSADLKKQQQVSPTISETNTLAEICKNARKCILGLSDLAYDRSSDDNSRAGDLYIIITSKLLNIERRALNKLETMDKEKPKAYILKEITVHIDLVAKIIQRGGFTDEKDHDQIALLKAKIKAYPEELYNPADNLIPIISGALLAGLCAVISLVCPVGWFSLIALVTVGFTAGRNITLFPAIKDWCRAKIATVLAICVGDHYKPLIDPVKNLVSLTERKSFSSGRARSLYMVAPYNSKMVSYKNEINSGVNSLNKEFKELCFYNDARPCVAELSQEKPSMKDLAFTEVRALQGAINKLTEGKSDLYDKFTKLAGILDGRRILANTNYIKLEYIKNVAQQARFLLEAISLSTDGKEKLNHFLLLQSKAEADPVEYSSIEKFIISVLGAALLTIFCLTAAHFAVLGTCFTLLDLAAGAAVSYFQAKGDSYSLLAAPTASKLIFDYVSHLFFSHPLQKQVLSIGEDIKSSIPSDCRVFLGKGAT